VIPLESTKLFNSLAPKEMERVRQAVREISFAPGNEIFREGDPGDGLYIVKSGLVQISSVLNHGDRVVLARLGAGEIFGEMAVLDQNPRSATALAENATELYFIPRDELLQIIECIPRLSAFFVREISRRLREFNAQYIRQVLQSERLALVGRFASSIVHDLKNPLNIIGISAEMAGDETANAEARLKSKERILTQVERISNMASELLEFARGSQPNSTLMPSDFAVFVENWLEEILPEAGLNAVEIELPNPPPSVATQINPARLSRVFHNLVRNAFDALAGEKGKVILHFALNGNEIVTEIEDSGPGIASEVLGNLFEPFTSFGKAHGTGLGLTICKRIVEDHKGKIYARNQPGGGAVFGFTLPVFQSDFQS
jgi:signal transduction histidine kinase